MEAANISKTNPLLSPYKMGRFNLSHRVILPSLTRSRSYRNVPQPHAIEYYSQRTTKGGLLISESNGACDISQGFPNMPGIWTKEQVEAWKPIVNAVHEKGGVFFCQLWHTGHVCRDYNQNKLIFDWESHLYSCDSLPNIETELSPHQLTTDDITCLINDFRLAARNAMEAGFDGVEVQAANGYLIERFMSDQVNKRTDKYGGSLENRCRLALQVIEAISHEVGADRVGIKLSPYYDPNGALDSDPETLGVYMANELSKLGILFINMVEKRYVKTSDKEEVPRTLGAVRKAFKGTFIVCGGYGKCDGNKAIEDDYADLIAFGRLFLANPDLPKRFELDAPLNKHERSTFYSSDPVIGYTDYPFLEVA